MKLLAAIAAAMLFAGCGTDCTLEGDAHARRPRHPHHSPQSGVTPDAGFPDSGTFDALPSNVQVASTCYGQSNCIVNSASSIVSTSGARPECAANTYAWTNTALATLYENQVNTGGVESPASGWGWAWSCREGVSRTIMLDVSAVGATACAAFSHGQSAYNNLITEMTELRTAALAARPSDPFYYAPIVWYQGGTDSFNGTAEATYCNCLTQLQTDLQTDLNTINGRSDSIPLYLALDYTQSTSSGGLAGSQSEATTSVHAYRCAVANPTQLLVTHAMYPIPTGADSLHYSPTGAQRSGEYSSKAYSYWSTGRTWQAYQMDRANTACTGTTITVPLIGGEGSCTAVANTSSVAAKQNYGFSYWETNPQADMPVITNVSLSGCTATLTLNRNCDSDGLIRYAFYNVPRAGQSPTILGAVGGNIYNSNTARMVTQAIQSRDWLIGPSEAPIASCTSNCGTPSSVSSDTVTLSFQNANSPAGYISCGNAPTAAWAGSQHFSGALWLRATTWQTGVVNLIGSMGSTRGMWGIRPGTSAGQIRFYLPASGSSFSELWTSAASIFSNATFYHIAWSYDGTQADNASRFHFYRNGTDITAAGTFSGTIPAQLTSSITDFAIGSWSEGTVTTQPYQFSRVALWHNTSITGTDVTNLYNAGTDVTPIGVVSTNPTLYMPLNGNTEVQGVNNYYCQIYGTGSSWPSLAP